MKKLLYVVSAILLLSAAGPALLAQSGCVNSPENPTAILALVGSGGALAASFVRRFRR